MASTSYAATAWALPSEHDLNAGLSVEGRLLQEQNFAALLRGACSCGNFVVNGFALPATGLATTRTLSGVAVIDGRYVGTASPHIVVDFPYATTFVFLRSVSVAAVPPNVEAGLSLVVDCYDAWTAVENSILLGIVTTAEGSITAATNSQAVGRLIWGNIDIVADAPYFLINNSGSNDWTPTKSSNDLVITFRTPILVAKSLILVPDSYERTTVTTALTKTTLTITGAFLVPGERGFAVLA